MIWQHQHLGQQDLTTTHQLTDLRKTNESHIILQQKVLKCAKIRQIHKYKQYKTITH